MLAARRVRETALVGALGMRRGFATLGELRDFLSESYGEAEPDAFANRLYTVLERTVAEYALPTLLYPETPIREMSGAILLSLPDDMFILAVELGEPLAAARRIPSGRTDPGILRFQADVAELFLTNGVPYEFDDGGRLRPSMSPSVSAVSVEPAVDVLNNPLLQDASHHFTEARRRLGEPDPEEAVDEARQAVEAGMLAVLDARNIPRPEKRQAQALFAALVARGMPNTAEELVLAAPRFRGRTSAGHAGGPAVSLDEAQAAVAAAAAALLYLAGKLPSGDRG